MPPAQVVLVAVLAALPAAAATVPDAPFVDALAPLLQYRSPDRVRETILAVLGPAHENLGSGLSIELWYVDGGKLVYHPMTGPTFTKGSVTTRLMRTRNLAGECLFGSYQMLSLPAPPHGMQAWIGALELSQTGYAFRAAQPAWEPPLLPKDVLFVRAQTGTVEVEWAPGVGPETILEDLADGSPVATLTLVAGRARERYRVVSLNSPMRLEFAGDGLPFGMSMAWRHYWGFHR